MTSTSNSAMFWELVRKKILVTYDESIVQNDPNVALPYQNCTVQLLSPGAGAHVVGFAIPYVQSPFVPARSEIDDYR